MTGDEELAAAILEDEKSPTPRMPKEKPKRTSEGPVRKVWVKVITDCKPWAHIHATEDKTFADPPLRPMGKSKRYLINSNEAQSLEDDEHIVTLESPK